MIALLRHYAALTAAVALAFAHVVHAAPDTTYPKAAFGSVDVLASAATAIPTAPLDGRYGIAIQNLGPNPIYCGWDSSVTTATGWQVAANGGVMSVDVSYNGSSGAKKLWCIAVTADQSGTADTRYWEVR